MQPVLSGKRAALRDLPPSIIFSDIDTQPIHRVAVDALRPTQMAVGMRAVEAKREKLARLTRRPRKLTHYLQRRAIPAVLGPGEELYIIDHHHLSLALFQSGVPDTFVRVVADFSNRRRLAFLRAMQAHGWLRSCDGEGRTISPVLLPATVGHLQADHYRDLAWSVREAGGFRKSPIPFSEFVWADFFREHIPAELVQQDFLSAHRSAMRIARSRSASHLPGCKRGKSLSD
ncbi:ParB-like protein [Hyphomicrobium sulfonivorans]|uniref:ParB-like protein n=1 Tax=Hyphomicrobium sulfonivorans TaxID=121290 RepID=UPI00157121C2|nr:ParB-like protein [Hyphomicrobium sulfonivorans]MBI1649366.1 hypothetical protein [Hyphomicrobium sulfonivorans]NSL71284.1 hypothetical protein [Hyphomicrobium sulfonivorans]